ncbi:hypothetical protein BgiMline_010882 [Biomphalaria glabrata]
MIMAITRMSTGFPLTTDDWFPSTTPPTTRLSDLCGGCPAGEYCMTLHDHTCVTGFQCLPPSHFILAAVAKSSALPLQTDYWLPISTNPPTTIVSDSQQCGKCPFGEFCTAVYPTCITGYPCSPAYMCLPWII